MDDDSTNGADSGAEPPLVEDEMLDEQPSDPPVARGRRGRAPRATSRAAWRERFIGQVIGGTWLVKEEYPNQGGMGYLVKAKHLRLPQWNAIKLVPDGLGDETYRERLRREAAVIAELSRETDYVVRVFELNEHEGVPYYVMPDLQGHNLSRHIDIHGGLSYEEVGPLFTEILRGVAVAHRKDVIHRDLKPENIFLETMDKRLHPRIIDFGVAKEIGRDSRTLTARGSIPGTPLYTAPEYYDGVPAEPHKGVDVFALGLIAYEMILGRHPWQGLSDVAIVARFQAGAELAPLHTIDEGREAGVPEGFSRAVQTALCFDPTERFADAIEFLRAVERARTFDPKALVGVRLKDRYLIEEKIGEGGMGVVYRAIDEPQHGNAVAIKMAAPPAWLPDDAVDMMFARFDQECAALVNADEHPNVIRFLDKDRFENHPYCVMEYIEGDNLTDCADMLWQGPGGWQRIVDVLEQIAGALDYAHGVGVIHRDIKPSNIVIDRKSGAAKLIDFGIARAGVSYQTKTGQVLGTPGYRAPEQLQTEEEGGGAVNASDQWALAALVYRLLTNMHPGQTRPDDTKRATALDGAVLTGQVVDLGAARPKDSVPAELCAAVMRGLAADPGDRYPSCREFIEAVRQASVGHDISPPPPVHDEETPLERPRASPATATPATRARWIWGGLAAAVVVAAGATVWYAASHRSDAASSSVEVPGTTPRRDASAAADEITASVVADPPDAGPAADESQFLPVEIVATRGERVKAGVRVLVDGSEVQTPTHVPRLPGDTIRLEVIDRRYGASTESCVVSREKPRCNISLHSRRRSKKSTTKKEEPPRRRSLIRHVGPDAGGP